MQIAEINKIEKRLDKKGLNLMFDRLRQIILLAEIFGKIPKKMSIKVCLCD